MKIKTLKESPIKHRESHTAPTKFGMGDFYGTGVKQKVGRLRGDTVGFREVEPSKMKKPPRSLA
jgi:hypothetical protein